MSRKLIYGLCFILVWMQAPMAFAQWKSHLSYSNVTQIALSNTMVYALSNGSLFSVNNMSEQIKTYDASTGLHSTGINTIGYDDVTEQLLVVYGSGKMDLLMDNGKVEYIGDFYTKDMTASKTTNNITFNKGIVYMAEPFGIVTFDMRHHEFVQCCYIGKNASEVNVQDIVILQDSIYAFTSKERYAAALTDNVLDYRNWHLQPKDSRIQRDENKGKKIQDAQGDIWEVGGEKGVLRHSITGQELAYQPDGPLNNTMYRIQCFGDKLYAVNGGAAANQYNRPGSVMIWQDEKWHNLAQSEVEAQKEGKLFRDAMNVAQDPFNDEHYYVSTYGTGVWEFMGDSVVNQFLPNNSSLSAAAPEFPNKYTRCVGATMDSNGALWVVVAGGNGPLLSIRESNGHWDTISPMINQTMLAFPSPWTMCIDKTRPNYKWVMQFRWQTGLLLVDDHGTISDKTDDRYVFRTSWLNQNEETITPTYLYGLYSAANGSLWFGGENTGLLTIPANTDYFTSDHCYQIPLTDESGNSLFNDKIIRDITADSDGKLWVATNGGVYVLSADATKVLHHYTISNSILSTNDVLSLAYCESQQIMYLGTAEGLFSYSERYLETGVPSDNEEEEWEPVDGDMHNWTTYFSYTKTTQLENANSRVFGMADGAIFSVDKVSEEVTTYSKQTGMSGAVIQHIGYDGASDQLVVIYDDNKIDVIEQEEVSSILDVYLKSSSLSIQVNDLLMDANKAYLAISLGVLELDLKHHTVANTYYIGANASSVNVQSLAIVNDTLYAASIDSIYAVDVHANMLDYANWKRVPKPANTEIQQILAYEGRLMIRQQGVLYQYQNGWQAMDASKSFIWARVTNHTLLGYVSSEGLLQWEDAQWQLLTNKYYVADAVYDASEQAYWLAVSGTGLVKYKQGNYQAFRPQGPFVNTPFRVQAFGDLLMVAPGGRWASQEFRPADAVWYNCKKKSWSVITRNATKQVLSGDDPRDILCYAVDGTDPDHFFAATYGFGVLEYDGGQAVHQYSIDNSTLRSAIDPSMANVRKYVRTDGAYLDTDGNLWVLNTGSYAKPLHVMSPSGVWYALSLVSNGELVTLETPGLIVQDLYNTHRKWMYDSRGSSGVILLDDGGTPYQSYDDKALKRIQFFDQNNKVIRPEVVYCLAQDKNGDCWVGYNEGIFILRKSKDFFSSNACERVIIPRNDGTGLADYLLGTEHIKTIAIDGANRKWIGTASSGVYLVSEDGMEELAHFTVENSPILSNEITSIAIHEKSGEVFIGTSKGLISYHGDAAEPSKDYSSAYAFPNPVRPNYIGVITLTGLMDKSIVNIVDAGGNLVCKTQSNGGIAIWDGCNQKGVRVATGVYTALCNTADGTGHTVIKILVQ